MSCLTSLPAVKISSYGCVSPLGIGRLENLESLKASRDGISPVRLFPVEGCQSKTAGQVAEALGEKAAEILPRARRWTRASQMMLTAMAEALEGSPGFIPDAVVIGTTSGGMTLGEEFYRAAASQRAMDRATRRVHSYFPNQPVLQALSAFHIQAPIRITSNGCASGTNALGVAAQMIRAGTARRVLAGGYDALAELVFSGFDCLKASTAEKCRPFDSGRSGLALGEGAAVFCLEANGPGQLRVTGYGSAIDTHHLTQPHPSGCGPREAMRKALAMAGVSPDGIDYINAHGTGTPLNDASEARAILELFPQTPVSSTKGMMGHSLGAAGAIEAAFCALALDEQFLPANINYRESDADLPLKIVANNSRSAQVRRTLSNSFGFGGANASILLERTAE